MATRHEITSIQFKADAGKANAAIDSIRQKAKEANDQMTQLRQKLEEGRKANLPIEDLKKMEDQLKSATKEAKQWGDAQRNLMRGVKALDEAIIQFNRGQGSVEKMSAALSKAARNAAQLQQSRMERGSQGWQEMEALITALDKNLVKARQDFDGLVQTIEAGGRVSVSELSSAKQSLKELSDLTAYGSDEWKTYDAQLQTIEKHISTLSQTEKRLAGEIVTVEDARKRAAAADAEAAQKRAENAQKGLTTAKEEAATAQASLETSKQKIVATEQEIAKTKEQLAAQQQLVGSIEALEDAESKAFSKMLAADTALQKQREETHKFSDATWEAAKKVGELEAKLKELDAQGSTPKSNQSIEELKKDLAEAETQLLRVKNALQGTTTAGRWASEYDEAMKAHGVVTGKAKTTKIKPSDYAVQQNDPRIAVRGLYHDESGYGVVTDGHVLIYDKNLYDKKNKGKIIATQNYKKDQLNPAMSAGDEIAARFPKWQAVSTDVPFKHSGKADLDALSDFLAGVNEREKEAWKQAKEAGETKRTLKDWMDSSSVIMKLPDGQYAILGTTTLTKTVAAARDMGANEMAWNDGDETTIRFTGKRGGVLATRKNRVDEGMHNQDYAYDMSSSGVSSISPEEAKAKIAQLEQEIAAKKKLIEVAEQEQQATQASVDVDKQKAELQQQLADAQQKLNEAKTAAEGPTKKLQEAEAAYTEAQKKEQEATEALAKAKGNMNLGEEEDKLDALERKHDDLTESLQKQKQAEQELAQNAADTRQKEQEAAIELAQAQNQSEESLKKSVEVLEQQNKTLEAGSAEWQENEQAIGKLNKRIEELKQQSQELRGEMMSLAEAQALAGEAGTKAFIASPEQLQKATAAIERRKKQLQETIQLQRRSREATDAEEKELKELELQLKKLKMEQDNFNMSHSRMDALLKQPTNAKNLDELRAAIKRAKAELNSMEDSLGKNSKAYKEMAADTKKAEIQLKEMEAQSKGTASAFDKAWSRLKTYVGLYVGAAVAMQKLSQAMGDLLTLSDKMGEVRKTTGFTADEVGRLSDNLAKLDTRTSLTQLMELSSLAGSVGLKTQEQVQGFTEAADQLIVALPELGNESARTIIKIANATGDLEKNGGNVRETLEKVGSTIIALRANSASAAGPITDFVSRVGAVGAQAGISIDQIAALGSTIDALGGRVEMSATALSRMIPAIKNNSFAIANSIGVTEKYLKSLAPMEQMVLIFQKMRDNIQHIDTSTEEGMNAMADNVEAMLGKNATMREVMKDLEQQGARAGIVFGLLSQNVDELEKQLGIASEAYRENTALANEFNNMNETAAAKWERLKNQVEEAFVGDQAQRWLGTIIDGLRKIVDLLTDNGTIGRFMRYSLVYLALLKAKWAETIGGALISMGKFIWSLRASAVAAEADAAAKSANATATTALGNATTTAAAKTNAFAQSWKKMNATMKANVIAAVATLLVWLGHTLWESHKAAKAADEAYGRLRQQINEEKAALDRLFKPLKNANLEHAEKERLIKAINSQYGSYLGKMLTEASNAYEIERAYAAINLQLEKKNLLEGIEANKKRVQEQQGGYLDSAFGEMDKAVTKASKTATDASAINAFITGAVKDAIEQGLSPEEMRKSIQAQLKKEISEGTMKEYVQIISGGMSRREESDRYIANAAVRYYNAQKKVQDNAAEVNKRLQADLDNLIGKAQKAADKDIPELIADYNKALSKGNDASKYTAKESSAVVEAFDAIKAYYDMHHDELSDAQKERISATLDFDMSKFRIKANAAGGGQFNNGSNSPTPYGTYNRVTSPYQDWDADALVSRRKEMLERVRALANGADVQAVLSEDAKFITEATRKNIKTTRDAIEWYNTERLKIQDALHEKHLTNTGDWMDPTGRRKREKTVKDEWSTYLNELDAYYTERKAKIQEQQNDGEISEAESWRRQLTNEAEWRQRRAELQQLYARKSAEVTEEEQQAIFNIIGERTGDSADFIRASIAKTVQFIYDIGKHSEAEMNNLFGRMDKGSEQDFLRQRNAIGKQMDAIRDIIEKERPFNGITENLQENLTKMGVLFGDMDDELKRLMAAGEDMAEFNAKQEQERVRRLSFLLQEAEHAYNTNIEEVMRHMAEAGMTAWVDYFKNNTDAQNALMAQLHTTFDKVQEAIKKEATLWKKEAENMWNNILLPDGETTLKQLADRTVAALSLDENRVSRANSLIGAGQASERVADRLALQQMRVQLAMQEHYYNIMHQRGRAAIDDLERQAKLARERGDIEEATRKELDAQHARMTLNLATAKEETDLAKQREEIIARTEESQNRLYTAMKEWADLLSSSLQSVFEATHAGDAEYFNERAKLNLTGKGGPGAGTYIVIDNEGTSDATAHYEYLNEREALERQREIANQNALADALKKALDDINMKMSEQITDWINASLQSASLDANTQAVLANTEALYETAGGPAAKPQGTVAAGGNGRTAAYGEGGGEWMPPMEMPEKEPGAEYVAPWTKWAEVSSKATETMVNNNKKVEKSTKASFAAMTAAANMYGIAYQAMSNENLSTAQKVEMMIVQAAGQAAISMLTASLAASEGETAANAPSWISKTLKELGPIGGPVAVGVFTALIGGLMGLATSKITKSKSEIAQVTGASHASAGRLSTGMLQYAEGNVNEFTDPSTLQTGKQYNVDAADGRTYRARFMGKGAKTHITHGPEFHLVGEAGREAIIDAKTTQNIRMNEPEIWRTIQVLSGGGRISAMRRRGRGVAAFADGNMDEMGGVGDMGNMGGTGMSAELTASLQASLDRNSDIMERIATEGIKGIFDVYGKDGLVETYDRGKKTMSRYGKRY